MAEFRHRDLQSSDPAELRRQLNAELRAIEAELAGLRSRSAVSAVRTTDVQARFGELVRVSPPSAGLRVTLPPVVLGQSSGRVVVVVEGDAGALSVEAVDSTVNGEDSLTYAAGLGVVEFVLTPEGWFGWSVSMVADLPLSAIEAVTAESFLGNFTAASASPTARAGSSVAGSHLSYTAGGTLGWEGFDLNVNGAVGSTGWTGIDIVDSASITWSTSVPGAAFLGLSLNWVGLPLLDEGVSAGTATSLDFTSTSTITASVSGAPLGVVQMAVNLTAAYSWTGLHTFSNASGVFISTANGFAGLRFSEEASSTLSVSAGQGMYWVRNDAPNVPMFTDDANGDHQLAYGAMALMREPQILTSGTSISHPAGTRFIRVRGCGSGGGGGGCNAASGSIGANGGSGTYVERWITLASLSSTYTIGTGGSGNSGAAGNGGQSSTFTHNSVTTTAPGGSGGGFAVGGAGAATANGGAGGGAATNADLSVPGQRGADAVRSNNLSNGCWHTGPGGGTPLGNGADGHGEGVGTDATGFGSGGSGRLNGAGSSAGAGGDGAPGVWIVEEYG